MQFRKALISDIQAIQQIAEKAWRPTYEKILTEEQTIYMLDLMYRADVLKTQIEGHIDFFMVEESSQILGYFAIEQTGKAQSKLHKLYLNPQKKSSGIGTKIIQFLKKWANERSIETIELNVNKKNSAVLFYEKMGFERISEVVLDIGQGYVMDDYVMQLNLKSAQ
jgi:N-acetylglutamate synthase-like GNAT family acetyltransferase